VLVNLNVRREARNKKKEHLKAKIEEFETNSKIKNIWDLYKGISDFKKGYQPGSNIVKDEKSDLITEYKGISDFKKGYQPGPNRVKDEKSDLITDSRSILAR
jgi:hypothetical protein